MRILRVITRLNIGGPSIQALALTSRLAARGATTTLLHGRLGEGEGDMRYLAAPDANLQFVPTLQRTIAPLDDLRTLRALYTAMREFKPTLVHTHMAKAGLLGRLAAFAYNLTRGDAPRTLVVHTYHGHVLEGYFSRVMTSLFIGLERLMATLSDAIIAISPAIREELLHTYRIGRERQYRVVPLGFDLAPFAAVDAAARTAARQALALPPDAPVISTVLPASASAMPASSSCTGSRPSRSSGSMSRTRSIALWLSRSSSADGTVSTGSPEGAANASARRRCARFR